MKKIFLIVTVFISFLSCKKEHPALKQETIKISEKSFEKVIALNAESILKEEFAKSIEVIDTFLIVKTSVKDNFLKIYNTSNLKLLAQFGKIGEGPDDFKAPYFTVHSFLHKGSGTYLWINDFFKYKVTVLNFIKSVDSSKVVIEKTFETDPQNNFTHDLIPLNDSIFYASNGPMAFNRKLIYKYDYKNKQILAEAGLKPKFKNIDILNPTDQYLLYFGNIGIKPNRTALVYVYNSFNRIDFYDLNLNLIKSIIDKDAVLQTDDLNDIFKKEKGFTDLRNYYYQVYCSDQYVYALHRKGQPAGEFGKKDIKVDIRVFDWEGTPKFLLKIPNDLVGFTVDEKNGWIYGIDYNNERNYRYKINFQF